MKRRLIVTIFLIGVPILASAQQGVGLYFDLGITGQMQFVQFDPVQLDATTGLNLQTVVPALVPRLQVGFNFHDYMGAALTVSAFGLFFTDSTQKKSSASLVFNEFNRIDVGAQFQGHIPIDDAYMTIDLGIGPHIEFTSIKAKYLTAIEASGWTLGPYAQAGFTYKLDMGLYFGGRISGNFDFFGEGEIKIGSKTKKVGFSKEENMQFGLIIGYWLEVG